MEFFRSFEEKRLKSDFDVKPEPCGFLSHSSLSFSLHPLSVSCHVMILLKKKIKRRIFFTANLI